MKKFVPAVLLVVFLFPLSANAEWRLMGRHGGCKTLAEAAKRKSVLKGISGPKDLAARLKRKGVKVTVAEAKGPKGTAVIVDAPGRGLSLIFVPVELCDRER